MKYLLFLFSLTLHGFSASAQPKPMTPEFLYSLGRLNLESVHTEQLLYSVKYTDLPTNTERVEYLLMNTQTGAESPQKLPLPDGASQVVFHPSGETLLFLKNGFLHSFQLRDGSVRQLSDFKMSAFALSGDGKKLASLQEVKYEQTAKERHPNLPGADFRVIDHPNYRHLKSWEDEFYANAFLSDFNPDGKLETGIQLMKGEPFDATGLTISTDGRYVAYESKKVSHSEQVTSTNSDVFLFDSRTGNTQNISADNEGYDQNPVFSPNNQFLAWSSMATAGYETDRKRLVVFDLKTGKKRPTSEAFDYNVNSPAWVNDGQLVFHTEQHGTTQLFSISLDGKTNPLTRGAHTVSSKFLATGKAVFYSKSTYTSPYEAFHVDLKNGIELQLSHLNSEAMKGIRFGPVKERFCTTFDELQLQSWVLYPPDFDPSKKYPVVLYCEGGPQSTLSNGWSLRWSLSCFAAQGYIVVAPNRRGVFGFGSKWTQQVSQSWGDKPMKDLLAAVDDVARETYVDKNSMAAIGASFGGYSVYWLAGNHEKRFKCLIAHAGLFNLESFDGLTDEKFFVDWDMGGPFFNNKKHPTYAQYSPHLYVEKWDTPILISQGGSDFRVNEAEAFQAFDAAQRKGVPARLIYFPTEGHGILDAHNSIVWYRETTAWLKTYLK